MDTVVFIVLTAIFMVLCSSEILKEKTKNNYKGDWRERYCQKTIKRR